MPQTQETSENQRYSLSKTLYAGEAKSDFSVASKHAEANPKDIFVVPARNPVVAGSTSSNCPCCGAALQNQRATVDLNTNSFLFRGRAIRMRPREAELLSLLVDRAPTVVPHDSLIAALWGQAEPGCAEKNIQVQICRLRKYLKGTGASIVTTHDVGYRFHTEGVQ